MRRVWFKLSGAQVAARDAVEAIKRGEPPYGRGLVDLIEREEPVSPDLRDNVRRRLGFGDEALADLEDVCPVPLTVRGTQALVSFAPLAFKLFCAARQNAVLRRSPFPPV